MTDLELKHYGVKGMRWGVRKSTVETANSSSRINKKTKRKNEIKKAVSDYNKKFNSAHDAGYAADEKYNQVRALYKKTGKTPIGRIINNAKNKSESVKAYSKAYDEWNVMQEIADEKWRAAKEAYIKTGKNRISRLINNIRYDKA